MFIGSMQRSEPPYGRRWLVDRLQAP